MPKPIIDQSKCDACGMCADMCPVNVFEKDGKKMTVKKPGDCIGCRACEAQCPRAAIEIKD